MFLGVYSREDGSRKNQTRLNFINITASELAALLELGDAVLWIKADAIGHRAGKLACGISGAGVARRSVRIRERARPRGTAGQVIGLSVAASSG